MTEPTELVVVLAMVYLLECLQLAPRHAVALQAWWGARFVLRRATAMGLWRGAAFVAGMPLPPIGLILVVDDWPVVLDEDALVGEDGVRHEWSAVAGARAAQQRVVIEEATVARMATESSALALARALRAIAGGEPAIRQRLVDEALARRLDAATVAARVIAFRRAARPLRLAETLLFSSVFAGLPLVLFTEASVAWPGIAGGGVIAWIATLVTYRSARRRCFPGADGPATGRVAMLFLWPLSAMRASDVLGRYLLPDVDPLAAATLLAPDDFRAVARRTLAELDHALEPRTGWADERRRHAILGLLQTQGVRAEELFEAPAPETPAVRRYCPRCRAQYLTEPERCASCPAIRLLPLG